MSGSVTFKDGELREMLKRCKVMHELEVKVGIQGNKAAAKHNKSGDLTNVKIGYIHEFSQPGGTPPGRPFIRPIYDNAPAKWKARIGKAYKQMLQKSDPQGLLRQLGEDYRKAIISRMKGGIAPPLAQSTIDRRRGNGSDATPLIDTGTLMGSISVAVGKKK